MSRGRAKAEWGRMSSLMALIANVNKPPGARKARPDDFNPMAARRKAPPMGAKELVDTMGALLGVRRLENG